MSSKTKKDMAFELFEQGVHYKKVAEQTGLKESTAKMYLSLFRSEQKQNGLGNELGNTKKDKGAQEECVIEVHSDLLRIGNDYYEFIYYLDAQDGTMWFDFMAIMDALTKERIIHPKTFKTQIADRYFRKTTVNGEQKYLIDKNALIDLAKEVDDYTFITSVMELYIGETNNTFYKFNQVLNSFEMMESLIANIDRKYEEVKAFNDAQFDLLHEYDNEEFLTDEELLEKAKKMQSLRRTRRTARNELVLTQNLRRLLKEYGMNISNITATRNKLGKLLDDLYSKKYNSRIEQLEDWQKEVVERGIEAR